MVTDFEKETLYKLDNEENLTDEELSKLVYNYSISEEDIEQGRWTMSTYTVCKLADRYFGIDWQRGLTEYQDDSFPYPPKEVRKHTYEKTVTVTEWIPVKKENS